MSQNERPTAAFVLSFIAGLFILIDGVALWIIGSFLARLNMAELMFQYMPRYTVEFPPTTGLTAASTVLYVLGATGIIFGAIILIGAAILYRNPSHRTAWGVIILVLSVISIATGGGFLVGAILGIVGGILALVWKPKVATTPTTAATQT
ncbi:MAG: DUF6114 domain-containing protein [Candidatus Bathyarchaeia archaeon]